LKYISIDGDDIGRKITHYYLTNNETKLKEFSKNLCRVTDEISKYLLIINCNIVFSAADGIVASFDKNLDINKLFKKIQEIESFEITFSAGVGDTLQEAYMALLYSKSKGKNCITSYLDIKNEELNYV
jgi:predicted DNA repair protein MutK